MEEHVELNKYITATDTTTTSNQTLPWKNNTTTPKLTQIRDNLHSNYISALFPNNDWLRWEAYTADDATKQKKQAIEHYISNKTRRENFRDVMSQLLYDYIDYGNAFAYTDYVHRVGKNADDETHVVYSGPVVKRVHPFDIVLNPLAPTFDESPIIIRSIMSIGELKLQAQQGPNPTEELEAIEKAIELRRDLGSLNKADHRKYSGLPMDGFGTYFEYLDSGYVEVLTFMGDYYNKDTYELEPGRKIQIIDRSFVLSDELSQTGLVVMYSTLVGVSAVIIFGLWGRWII